jgi:hypothetical protein
MMPMPDGNQIRKITHNATPSQRWMKIAMCVNARDTDVEAICLTPDTSAGEPR